eukprot:gene21664-28680_t
MPQLAGRAEARHQHFRPLRAAPKQGLEFDEDFEEDDGNESKMPSELNLERESAKPVKGVDPADESGGDAEDENEEWDDWWEDNSYEIRDKNTIAPDFEDPDWSEKVGNWAEFWHHSHWESEIEQHGDPEPHLDAGGKVMNPVKRAKQLIKAINKLKLRSDAVRMLTPPVGYDHYGAWEFPPCPLGAPLRTLAMVPPMSPRASTSTPGLTKADVRARAEKLERKNLMDLEWRRRQALVGKFEYPNKLTDERMKSPPPPVMGLREDYSDVEIRNLITNNGLLANPDDHGATIMNPLVGTDYSSGQFPVKYIESTEEYLERIGHLASPEEFYLYNEDEITIDAAANLDLGERDLERFLDGMDLDEEDPDGEWDDGNLTWVDEDGWEDGEYEVEEGEEEEEGGEEEVGGEEEEEGAQ